MSLRVIRAGLHTTVQDLGRRGLQRYGVVVGGAMDPLALRVANLLVGNDENAAALEMILAGPHLRFEQEALIAVCGGDLQPSINGEIVPAWRPVWVRMGGELSFGHAKVGCAAYLAITGGIDVPIVMGSRSTYLRAGIGGLEGRALKAGDALAAFEPSPDALPLARRLARTVGAAAFAATSWHAGDALAGYAANPTIRVTRGGELDWLDAESQSRLFSEEFRVTPQSDRMGYRLAGPPLTLATQSELISEAVCPGTVQVPADGQPIVLMADGATTGGYAKAAQAATVDLPRLAQAQPGARLRFQLISIEEAQHLYRAREADLARLRRGIALRWE